jgi:hypothetical protein
MHNVVSMHASYSGCSSREGFLEACSPFQPPGIGIGQVEPAIADSAIKWLRTGTCNQSTDSLVGHINKQQSTLQVEETAGGSKGHCSNSSWE